MVIKTVRNKSFCRLSVTMLPAITKGLRATSAVFTFTVDDAEEPHRSAKPVSTGFLN